MLQDLQNSHKSLEELHDLLENRRRELFDDNHSERPFAGSQNKYITSKTTNRNDIILLSYYWSAIT